MDDDGMTDDAGAKAEGKGWFQGFEKGYRSGQAALKFKCRSLLSHGCHRIAVPAFQRIVVMDCKGLIQQVASRGRSENEDRCWRLWTAYRAYQSASDECVGTYIHLLEYMEFTLRDSDCDLKDAVAASLTHLRNRFRIFAMGPAKIGDARSAHTHGAVESPGRPKCEACRFELGCMAGQMELILAGLESSGMPDETILLNMVHALGDGSIPFPLAPPCITGWQGGFLDFQLDWLNRGLERQDTAARNLVDVFIQSGLAGEIESMVR